MIYDVAILGAGIAGVFSALKILEKNKECNIILLDLGRPFLKRRSQMIGALGVFPNSDGKLYLSDIEKLKPLINEDVLNKTYEYVLSFLNKINTIELTKSNRVQDYLENNIKKDFNISYSDYYQYYPNNIHNISKYINNLIIDDERIFKAFDTEIFMVKKEDDKFLLDTEIGNIEAKKIILSSGRSGWRWAQEIFENLNIPMEKKAHYGIKVEIGTDFARDFNNSIISLYNDNMEIGPFSWGGTVIPEDHIDLVVASFRSNENRWKTDKLSFSAIYNIDHKDGALESERFAKLVYILSNDRVGKEKILSLESKKSKISVLPEISYIMKMISLLKSYIPEIGTKGYFYYPTTYAISPKIKIKEGEDGGKTMESEDVPGLFVAGENAGYAGLLSAMITGTIAGDNIL